MDPIKIDHARILFTFQEYRSLMWLAKQIRPAIDSRRIHAWIHRNQIPGPFWAQLAELSRTYGIKVLHPDTRRRRYITLELLATTAPPHKPKKRGNK
jgi:hypothetical protein